MIQRWQYLFAFAALLLCAGCSQARNYSSWGHSPQTATPVDLPVVSSPATIPIPTGDATAPSNTDPTPVNPPTTLDLCAFHSDNDGDNTDNTDSSETNSAQPAGWRAHFRDDLGDLWPEIKQDYRNYYSWQNFGMLVAGFSVAAVTANTSIDRELDEKYQQHVRSPGVDHFSQFCKEFGNGGYMFTAMAAGWVAGDVMYDTKIGSALGEWGERSLRSTLVGTPPMLFAQYLTGGARPGHDDDGSGWRPFTHSNGVSGHAYVGGLVFIDAAKMTDNLWLKAGFYTLSAFPAWSRVNDFAHYPSQAFLGWWMAYCAATSVDETYRTPSDWKVVPLPLEDGVGMGLSYQY